MVNRQSTAAVFVDNREGRTGDTGFTTECSDQTFCENSLPGAEFTLQGQDRAGPDRRGNLPPERFRFGRAIGNERSHFSIVDWSEPDWH